MSLNDVWAAAASNPYSPVIGKDSQFAVGFSLLISGKLKNHCDVDVLLMQEGLILTGLFGLSKTPTQGHIYLR